MIVGISLNRICSILLSIIIWTVWFIYFILKNKKLREKKEIIKIAFLRLLLFLYIGFIIGLTLFPIAIPPRGIVDDIFINLNLFELFKYGFDKYGIVNILGNVLLFTPLIILTSLNSYKLFDKIYKVIICGIIFSLCIECMQYAEIYFGVANSARSVDIVDVILNTIGALIGFIVFKVYCKSIENNEVKNDSCNEI